MAGIEEKVRSYLRDREVDTTGVGSGEDMAKAPEGFRPKDYPIRALASVRCSMCMAVCPKEIWGKS